MHKIGIGLLALSLFFSCKEENIKTEIVATPVVSPTFSFESKSVKIFTTAKDTELRLTETGTKDFETAQQPIETENAIFVNPNKTFQTFIGIGGAITDASAETLAKLSPAKQEELIAAYYGESGINYTLLRTNIHSCDFSSGSYTYIDEGDSELKTFSIEHDMQFRIPMLKRAIAAAGGSITTYVTPWSPPAFMKTTNQMLRGGKLLPEYAASWANYYAKFIKAYEAIDIPIWGLTIQNEPMATQTWESCLYSAEDERDFLKNHLGPTLEREGLGDKKIVVWDHNRDLMPNRANTIFGDPEASKYAWGIGFHWYETWRGGQPMFENLGKVQEAFPDKKMMFTEGCNEKFVETKYQHWPNAERYGLSMIKDFNYGTVAWTDWNILLDQTGGPNHVGNFCFAPIHADTRTGELIYTPAYYYIGHFSKYIRPDAKRISTASSHSDLVSTSFLNVDGSIVTVVMNDTDHEVPYILFVGGSKTQISIPARAIQTVLY